MCRGIVAMRSEEPQLKQFVGHEMLRGAFAAVAGAGPNQQAELLHLARDILAMETPFPDAPREVGVYAAGVSVAVTPKGCVTCITQCIHYQLKVDSAGSSWSFTESHGTT